MKSHVYSANRTTDNARTTPVQSTSARATDNNSMAPHPFISFESISRRPKTNDGSYEDDCNEYYRTRRYSPITCAKSSGHV